MARGRYLLLIVLLLFLCLHGESPDAVAQSRVRPGTLRSPRDAQSTTGPKPPEGVDVRGSLLASTSAVIMPGVPAYDWHHGCGPTAAGMVLGYYDGQGFGDLVPGSAATQTAAVNAMIATEGEASNYTDYCLPIDAYPDLEPDRSGPPEGDEHADNCVADFMKTSQSAYNNYYGWSWLYDVGVAMIDYISWVGNSNYVANYTIKWMTGLSPALTWDNFRAEIDAHRPPILLVDTDGDGNTDHFVTAVGYDTVSGVQKYGCYTTWDDSVHWFDFAPMAEEQNWGIHSAVFFEISLSAPTATPTVTPTATQTPTPSPTHTGAPTSTPTRTSTTPAAPALLHLPLVFKTLPPLTLTATSDAMIAENQPGENFGRRMDMWAGRDLCEPPLEWTRSLLHFELAPVSLEHEIASATLRVYLVNSCDWEPEMPTRRYTVRRVSSAWEETAVAWNEPPSHAEAYGSADIQHAAWDWYTFDVTELVRAWEEGVYENYGLMILGPEGTDDPSRRGFSTREGYHPPELVITFSR